MPNPVKTYVDKSRETIIWCNNLPFSQTDIFGVDRAGITFPHENYAIRRTRNSMRAFEHLYVIEYVMSGVGYIESEGMRTKVEAGDLYIIHRRTVHTYYADKQQPFSKKWINVWGTYVNSLAEVFLDEEPFSVIHNAQDCEPIIDRIHQCLKDQGDDTDDRIMKLLLDIFLKINAIKKSSLGELSLFERITEYIDKNLGANLTVASIAEKFYTSPSTLYRMFSNNIGISPKEYILNKKIESAKRMIAANDSTFNNIAASLRFYDSHHFFRVFHSATGMSPSEYKKKVLEERD